MSCPQIPDLSREAFDQENNYAAKSSPYMLGCPPLSPDVEDTLVNALIEMDRLLRSPQ